MKRNRKLKWLTFLGGVVVIALSVNFFVLQNFDVRGLTGWAASRARANDLGVLSSITLKLNQGEFEFKFFHFQNGHLVDTQFFYDREDNRVEPMRIERKELLTIGFNAPSENGMNFFLSTEVTEENDTITVEHTEIATLQVDDWSGMGWEQFEGRIRLEEDERVIAGWFSGTTRYFPSGLERTFKEDFQMSEYLEFLSRYHDVFLLTIRKVS